MDQLKTTFKKILKSFFYIFIFSVLQCRSQNTVSPDVLRLSIVNEPQTLNALLASNGDAYSVASLIYESLMTYDLKTQTLVPQLAESWEVLPDQKTYRFHLRQNVFWHDHTPFTPNDVIATFNYVNDDVYVLAHYKNLAKQIKKIEITDKNTLEVTMAEPYFRGLISVGTIPILPKHILDQDLYQPYDFIRDNSVGTGPYVLKKWEPRQRLIFERFENYWNEKPQIRELEIQFVSDGQLKFQKLKKNDLDLLDNVSDTQWLRQASQKIFEDQFYKVKFLSRGYSAILWNQNNELFKDKKVRQALSHLFNRKLILEKLRHNLAQITTGPFLPGSNRYSDKAQSFDFDPVKAVQLLNEAGWQDHDHDGWLDRNGQKFSFTIMVNTSPYIQNYASIYQHDLKNVGIDMQMTVLEDSVLIERVLNRDFAASFFQWSFGIEDDIAITWHSAMINVPGSYNAVSYHNKQVDAWIEQTQIEYDATKRNDLYKKIHEQIADDQPYTFLYVNQSLSAISKKFKNVNVYPEGYNFMEWQTAVPKELK